MLGNLLNCELKKKESLKSRKKEERERTKNDIIRTSACALVFMYKCVYVRAYVYIKCYLTS